MAPRRDAETARQGRQAALVIAGSAMLSILAPVIVRGVGLPPRYEMLFYLASLAGFVWALVVTWRIWQKSRD